VVHEFGAHQTLIPTSDLDKIDVRIGTILAVEDAAHSEARRWIVALFSLTSGVDQKMVSDSGLANQQRDGFLKRKLRHSFSARSRRDFPAL
jgi:hypothetical protein